MNIIKAPELNHDVHELVSRRWSPYVLDARSIPQGDLLSIFEAARWAPSSYNEQPWRYIVAPRDNEPEFQKLLSCLVEGNQAWAQHASALALGLVSTTFARNEKPNQSARHDLGLASAFLTLEATARGIMVHQMGGILPDRAREIYAVPENFDVVTGIALGYVGAGSGDLAARDAKPRTRRPLSETLFASRFGRPFND